MDHIKEMQSKIPEYPVFFMKSENALIYNNLPFFIPDFSNDIQYECEIVLRICKNGKNIEEQFASSYYDAVTLGIDFTARDLQKQCIKNGEPWEIAKAFDFSAPIGEFVSLNEIEYPCDIDFCLKKNGTIVQKGNSKNMIFSFDKIISHISKYITIKTGDVVFTGTPAGVGSVEREDLLEAFLFDRKVLSQRIK